MSIKLDSLSSEAQSEIGNLFGPEPSPSVEAEASTDVEELDMGTEEVDGNDNVDVNDEPSDDLTDMEAGSDEDDSETSVEDIEWINAGGKKVKVDYSDREKIKRVTAMAAGARQWQSERDEFKTQLDDVSGKYTELKETMDYLEEIKDDHADLFEAITGNTLESKFREWAEEQNMLSGMTDNEKSMYLSNQEHTKRMREVERQKVELQKQLDNAEKERQEAAEAKQTGIANPVFFKYNFDNELGDPKAEYRLNNMLWGEAKKELSAYDTVTPDMVEETFERISNEVRTAFNIKAKNEVKKTVKTNRKKVKAAAQKMAVAAPTEDKKAEFDEKIKKGDFLGLMTGGFDDLIKNY